MDDLNVENSVFGVAGFGEDIFTKDIVNVKNDLVYYTKVFKKNSYELWHKLEWLDNQNKLTFGKIKIEVRIRTGDNLPIKDYNTNERYTLNELNDLIKNQTPDYIDTMLFKFSLNRSLTLGYDSIIMSDGDPNLLKLGTATNSTRLPTKDDALWTYWSLPILNSPSYIPLNNTFDYLQARIYLLNIDKDPTYIPEVFRINFSSILKS